MNDRATLDTQAALTFVYVGKHVFDDCNAGRGFQVDVGIVLYQ
jgi:hypothetical protein